MNSDFECNFLFQIKVNFFFDFIVALEKWEKIVPELAQKKMISENYFGLNDELGEIEKQLLRIEAICQLNRFADISCLKMRIEELEVRDDLIIFTFNLI